MKSIRELVEETARLNHIYDSRRLRADADEIAILASWEDAGGIVPQTFVRRIEKSVECLECGVIAELDYDKRLFTAIFHAAAGCQH
jgi:hypothetical protein